MMRHRIAAHALMASALAAGALAAAGSAPARAAMTYVIGVDNVSPSGHNFEYVDFFPRTALTVTTGDVVDFKWNPGAPDGAHTVTVLKQGETPQQKWAATPGAVPDGDDGAGSLQQNPAVVFPSDPSCGTQASPCAYDGSTDLNSGFAPNPPGHDFFVRIDLAETAQPQTVSFVSLIQPGMFGSMTLAASGGAGSTPASVAKAAADQYRSETANALAAEAAANSEAVKTNPDGTRTVTVTAGTAVPGVEITEMLPTNVHIAATDKVTWVTRTAVDIHTVTFPTGAGSDGVDPVAPPVCEGPGADTPAAGPPPAFGCGSPANVELPFVPQPQGATAISTPTTVGTSGVLGSPLSPFPQSYTFSFPSAGVFQYVCKFHDHMVGTVFAAQSPAYTMAASDGGVFPFGAAGGFGSLGGTHLNQPVVGIDTTPDGGYWLVAADGGVFPFGDAGGFGSTGGMHLNQPIVGMAATPDARGYWLVASDGGIFPFGDARGFGSTGGITLNKPIVGMAATPTGGGYWLVASDGGLFPFGDAAGYGSLGATHLNQPVVGIAATATGRGFWMVARDGGVFPFGDAQGFGSTGGIHLNQPIVTLAPTVHGDGYWLIASDGGVFPFGAAAGIGSLGGTHLNKPIVGAAGA